MSRPKMLGMVYWDLENRATLHLLFILWDLWPRNKDALVNIFYRMFPRFQRARCVLGHLRDQWQQRWHKGRGSVDFRAIDRPNSYRATNLTQAELDDLATLRAIIEAWATYLNIQLTPVANPTRNGDGQPYNLSGGVVRPNFSLAIFVNQFTNTRTALLPGDAIPDRTLDEMHYGSKVYETEILAIPYGMPLDGLDEQLAGTVGVDVDEDGDLLDVDEDEEDEYAPAFDPSTSTPDQPAYFHCEKCHHPRQNDLRAREGFDHCLYCTNKLVDRDFETERKFCLHGHHDSTRLQFCWNEDLVVDEMLPEHPRRCVLHASFRRGKTLPQADVADDEDLEDEDLYGLTDDETKVDDQDNVDVEEQSDEDQDTFKDQDGEDDQEFTPAPRSRPYVGGKYPPGYRPVQGGKALPQTTGVNAPRKAPRLGNPTAPRKAPGPNKITKAPRKSTAPRKATAPHKSSTASEPSKKKRRVAPTPVLPAHKDPFYLVNKLQSSPYLMKMFAARNPGLNITGMNDEELASTVLGPSRQMVSSEEAVQYAPAEVEDDEDDGAEEQGEEDEEVDEEEMARRIDESGGRG